MANPVATLRPTSYNFADFLGTFGVGTGSDWKQYYGSGSPTNFDAYSPVTVGDNSDSTWIVGLQPESTLRLGVNTQAISLASGAQIVRVRPRARIATQQVSSAYTTVDLNLYLALGAAGSSSSPITTNSSSFTTVDGAWNTTAPDGSAWTVDKVNGLRTIALLNYNNGNNNAYVSIADIWIEVEYNNPPTVAFTSPTYDQLFTDNARPQFTWGYTDPQSDAESQWQVQITDSTTSVIQVDSAVTSSSATSWTPPSALSDGVHFAFLHAKNASGTWSQVIGLRFTINTGAPTVAITSPGVGATITTTDKPTFQWTFTDDGGADQDRYQLLIFTTQQNDPTAAVGAAVVSSGEQFSSKKTYTLPNALPNGDYWVYIKAGNATAGGRYSAWAGVPFHMSVSPASAVITTPVNNTTLTDTNKPFFQWTFSSPLGYAQERFQILVFTAGQNDPTAAADHAVLNSGEKFTSGTSYGFSTGLAKGVYYAYLRVADVGSGGRYSPWVLVIFKVDTLPAAIPVVTVDPTPIAFPHTANVPSVLVNVMSAENAMDADSASFEGGVGQWTAAQNGTIVRSSSYTAQIGTYVLQATANSAGLMRIKSGTFRVEPGRFVSGATRIRQVSGGAKVVHCTIYFYRLDGSSPTPTQGPSYQENSTNWLTVESTVLAPPDAIWAELSVEVEGCSAGNVQIIDKAYLRVTPWRNGYPVLENPAEIWPINLFESPAFQDPQPGDARSPWTIINTATSGTDPDPGSYHSGDPSDPVVSNPAPPSLLDVSGLPTAKAAWGLRRLRAAYTGKAVNVYRYSDAQTADIGFTAANDFDDAALTAFLGTSKGGIKILYDQSGNGYNLTETDPTHMFVIYSGTAGYKLSTATKARTVMYAEDAVRGMITAAFTSYTGSALSAVAVGSMPSGGSVVASGKTGNVIDDFSSQNTALWNGYSTTGISIVSGQLEIMPSAAYPELITNGAYDLTESFFAAKIVRATQAGSGSIEGFISVFTDASNSIDFILANGNLGFRQTVNGDDSDATYVTYNSTTHAWWRIRHSGTTIYWDTSPDGATWTNRRSEALGIGAVTQVQLKIGAGYWGTETPTQTMQVDNVNLFSGSSVDSTKTESLSDNFSSADTSKWTGYDGNPFVSGGQLHVTATSAYETLSASATKSLVGSYAQCEVVSRTNIGTGTTENTFELSVSSGNNVGFIIANDNIGFYDTVSSSQTVNYITYDSTAHRWWRIREASGTIYWDTSPDGTTWTNRKSRATGLTVTAVTIKFEAGYYGTETITSDFIIDNLNQAAGSGGSSGSSGGGLAPVIATAFGSSAVAETGTQGAVLIGRNGSSAQQAVTRNGSVRATQTLVYDTPEMWVGIVNDPAYKAGVDGLMTTGSSASIGALATTKFGIAHAGNGYRSAQGLRIAEVVIFTAEPTTTQLNAIQTNVSTYYGTAGVPTAGAGGGTTSSGSGGSNGSNPAFTLIASDDCSTNKIGTEWEAYDYGNATGYGANSWMARNFTYNASGKYYDLKAWKNGSKREGAGVLWHGPSEKAIMLGGAWELDVATDDQDHYGLVFLMWPDGPNPWPIDGEIDVFEVYDGGFTSCGESNYHLDTTADSSRALNAPSSAANSSSTDISRGSYGINLTQRHTIRVEWVPGNYLATFVDGVMKAKTTNTSYIPHTWAMRLTLQQEFYAAGSDSSVPSTWEAHSRIYGARAYKYVG